MSREKNHSKKKEERKKIEEGDEMKLKRAINICSCWRANGARPNGIASRLSPSS